MLIVNAIGHDRGWSPIQHMVALATELFEGEAIAADGRRPSETTKLLSVLLKRNRNRRGHETCLLIGGGPSDLLSVLNMENWRKRFRYLAAWIIDSFWVEHIPRTMRFNNPFDQIFVTSVEDIDPWKAATGVSTSWLPWGTDVLRLGQDRAEREWDLTRVGRQPPEWDDDGEVARAAAARGIKFRGRPDSTGLDALQNQRLMMNVYGSTKFLLAFSTAVNRDANNHPVREYLTGRWVDALGSGAIVAGVAPRGPTMDAVLWPGATLELRGVRRADGLQVISSALQDWLPQSAATNHQIALSRLDWRWRFKQLAEACDIQSARLNSDLKVLEDRIAQLKGRESLHLGK